MAGGHGRRRRPTSGREAAPSLLARAEGLGGDLPALLVAAERVAAAVWQGAHGRRRVGQGEAFWQFRRYEAGDPLNRIDWRRSARTEHVYCRQSEWEAAQTVWLWADVSPSMRYRSRASLPTKAERAALLALALAGVLIRAGERVARLAPTVIGGVGREVLQRLAAAWAGAAVADERRREHDGSLPAALPVARYSRVVLLSDFLSDGEALRRRLAALARRGVRGHLLHVIDPAEAELPFTGRVRFEGLEREGALVFGRAESIRADYQAAFAGHGQRLRELAHALGWTYASHRTDRPPEPALLALYLALATPAGW